MRCLLRVLGSSCIVSLLVGCEPGADTGGREALGGAELSEAAIQRAALTELFRVRERAGEIALWADSNSTGPVLSALRLVPTRDVATPDSLPASAITLAELESMFRDAPDGWRAFYQRFPRSPGLVEVGQVVGAPRRAAASIVIGRSCGEHCRMAWRVHVVGSAASWMVERVELLDLSGSDDRS